MGTARRDPGGGPSMANHTPPVSGGSSGSGSSGSGGSGSGGSGSGGSGSGTPNYANWGVNDGGSVGVSSGGGGRKADPNADSRAKSKIKSGVLLDQENSTFDLNENAPSPYKLPEVEGPNPERIDQVDTDTLKNMLQQIVDTQKQQSENQINYAVEQGTNELNRAMEDAAKEYQTQRDQASAEEAKALDNQALYSEVRGDRGGIGEAQYASIQNAAAQNRRAVNDAQVKLGTDTARQIADLRAQGEFTKADQLLSITQSYLSDLMGLEQWALEANLGVDEFNSQLQQWVDEYNLKAQQYLSDLDLSAAQLTGVFSNGSRTYEAQQKLMESLVNSGNALLQAGVLPSRQQLEAMGLTDQQAKAYLNAKNIKF